MAADSVDQNSNQETENTKNPGAGGDVGGTAIQAIPPKEKIKFYIAIGFVFTFLAIIGLPPFILLFFGKIKVNDYKDIVLTLAGVLGGPFGIVINNYFKEGQDR